MTGKVSTVRRPALARRRDDVPARIGAGTVMTDFGYAVGMSRVQDGFCKAVLVARPHRVLGRLRVSMKTGEATTTLVGLPGAPEVQFRWWGELDLEVANRTLEAHYRTALDESARGVPAAQWVDVDDPLR